MEPFGNRLRVLVVDDNRDAADSLATLLRIWGHHVDVAYDGANGLATAQSLKSQVLILDIAMPNMHGGELAARLRNDPMFASALIIAASAYPADDRRLDGYREHFDNFIGKPYNLAALESLLVAHVASGKQ
jgi:CheY-like chemotaxis protein